MLIQCVLRVHSKSPSKLSNSILEHDSLPYVKKLFNFWSLIMTPGAGIKRESIVMSDYGHDQRLGRSTLEEFSS